MSALLSQPVSPKRHERVRPQSIQGVHPPDKKQVRRQSGNAGDLIFRDPKGRPDDVFRETGNRPGEADVLHGGGVEKYQRMNLRSVQVFDGTRIDPGNEVNVAGGSGTEIASFPTVVFELKVANPVQPPLARSRRRETVPA